MIAKGIYTITETVDADGHTWGKLESGQGWIALEFTTRGWIVLNQQAQVKKAVE